ncbi:hypothetical protein [Micromonospora thermarum]|uniref:hypothetical protein n=1 Tax=Micromonospora thermarum TaxID=2720024 RepID=UPI001F0E9B1C|nr:hypothetical protein [Micromonospora thermarum]
MAELLDVVSQPHGGLVIVDGVQQGCGAFQVVAGVGVLTAGEVLSDLVERSDDLALGDQCLGSVGVDQSSDWPHQLARLGAGGAEPYTAGDGDQGQHGAGVCLVSRSPPQSPGEVVAGAAG